MRLLPALVVSLAIGLSFTAVASARPARINQIPNGTLRSCANCHVNQTGGGARNAFGSVIETSYLSPPGSAGVVQWQPSLAALDSDGDGRSNGLELQDPNGTWMVGQPAPGNPALVTLPGSPDSPVSVPALSSLWSALLGLSFLVAGVAAARVPRSELRRAS
jgi:hypothetical protein